MNDAERNLRLGGDTDVTSGDAGLSTAARLGLGAEDTAVLPRVVLVGNPNVGKSVLFGFLTRRYVTVSNYPGTTVTITRGKAEVDGRTVEVLDSPGINSLVPMSEDEEVTRNILLQAPPTAIAQVADAKNLRRALILSTQLAEMGLPFVLDLNMNDEAAEIGVRIDREKLEQRLGVRVVRTVATRRKGLDELRQALSGQRACSFQVTYPPALENAITAMAAVLPDTHIAKRALAVSVLSGDDSLRAWLHARVGDLGMQRLDDLRRHAAAGTRESLSVVVNRARLQAVDALLREVETRPTHRMGSWLDRVGTLSMHPLWGLPVLLAVLWGMYQFVGVLGAGTLVNLLETKLFGNLISPAATHAIDAILRFPHTHRIVDGVMQADYTLGAAAADPVALTTGQNVLKLVHDLFVGPYGQVTMALSYAIALILPIVTTFFLAFGVLEDSGYLPRLAVMVNRLFRMMGLNGKAVLPMVLGLGCDTMATLTTRILETKKERILVTLLLALGVPCSAQLGVILGMIRSLSFGATLVWASTIVGTMFLVGFLGSKLVPGQSSDFILELPPIRRPQLGNLVVKTLARIEWYLKEAVPLFLLGTLVLFLADRLRILGFVERVSEPLVVGILGLPAKAADAFLIGFLRRDYGAAGLYDMARDGLLDPVQVVVSMVTITLFVPCIANFFIMIKERGAKTALLMTVFIVPFALAVGGALNFGLHALGVTFQ